MSTFGGNGGYGGTTYPGTTYTRTTYGKTTYGGLGKTANGATTYAGLTGSYGNGAAGGGTANNGVSLQQAVEKVTVTGTYSGKTPWFGYSFNTSNGDVSGSGAQNIAQGLQISAVQWTKEAAQDETAGAYGEGAALTNMGPSGVAAMTSAQKAALVTQINTTQIHLGQIYDQPSFAGTTVEQYAGNASYYLYSVANDLGLAGVMPPSAAAQSAINPVPDVLPSNPYVESYP